MLIPPQFLYMLPAFLIVLTVIVFVHEMGHYLVARWNGIAIQTFSIGFGPELIGLQRQARHALAAFGDPARRLCPLRRRHERLRACPTATSSSSADPELAKRLFVNKNPWQRIAVVVAGPAANVIFTFLVLYALLLGYGRYTIPPLIGDRHAGLGGRGRGAASRTTRVLSVDGYEVRGFEDFQRLVATAPQRPVTIVVDRPDGPQTIVVVPEAAVSTDRFGNEHRIGRIGVTRSIDREEVTLYRPGPGRSDRHDVRGDPLHHRPHGGVPWRFLRRPGRHRAARRAGQGRQGFGRGRVARHRRARST